MREKTTFSQLLKEYHQKMVTIFCFKQLQQFIGILALCLASILIISRFIVIVEWKALLIVASILSCLFVGVKTHQKWPSFKTSVKKYNAWIDHDYVLTTFELDSGHATYSLLLSRTVELMKQNHSTILRAKQPLWDVKWISIAFICLFISFASYTFPSNSQIEAAKQNEINELVKETQGELEQLKERTKDEQKKELVDVAISQLNDLQELDQLINQMEKLNEEVNLQLLKDFEKMDLLKQVASIPTNEWSALQEALKNQNLTQLKDTLSQMDGSNLPMTEQALVEGLKQLTITEEELQNLLEGKWDQQLAAELNDLGKKVENTAKNIDPNQSNTYDGTIVQGPINENNIPANEQPVNQTNNETNHSNQNQTGNDSQNNGTNNDNSQNNHTNNNGAITQGNNAPSNSNGSTVATEGSGVGSGQGNRELTLPSRILSEHSIEVDTGVLEDGQQGVRLEIKGLAEKGQMKDYEKILNAYNSINQQAMNRTPLPSNLSELVKSYFSTME